MTELATMLAGSRRSESNTASLAPIHYQRRAQEWLELCRAEAARAQERAPGILAALDLLDTLRSPLNLNNGRALAALCGERSGHAPWTQALVMDARRRLYRLKLALARQRVAMLARTGRTRALPVGPVDVLVLPRLTG